VRGRVLVVRQVLLRMRSRDLGEVGGEAEGEMVLASMRWLGWVTRLRMDRSGLW